MERPSDTAATMVEKLSSASTMSLASLATSVPEMPMATPMSASFRAGASFTPSPVIAATSPWSLSSLTMSCLCLGSARLKTRPPLPRSTAICFSIGRDTKSRPVNDLSVRSSLAPNTPIFLQIASAVILLSPVMTMTRIPAWRHCLMASATSGRGGSCRPTKPTNTMLDSTSLYLAGSASSLWAGWWMSPLYSARGPVRSGFCARARQRRAPAAMRSTSLRMVLRAAGVRGTTLPSGIITRLQRSSTHSAAPLHSRMLEPPAAGLQMTDMLLRSRSNSRRATTGSFCP
mmetsp:Transcript_20295/g.44335  ORF Transcript_20295/g.44335 Transcript_20295/m.44335 type:complete len:288 (+) Transcript_20295:1963-2826(+)